MTTALRTEKPEASSLFLPEPATVEETGLDYGFILDLCLKTIYYAGRPSARAISDRLCLAFSVIEGVLEFLRRQEYVEIVGATGITEQDYQYALTSKGETKTQEVLERSQYVGPAPVPFDLYEQVVARQGIAHIEATPERLAEETLRLLGDPAAREAQRRAFRELAGQLGYPSSEADIGHVPAPLNWLLLRLLRAETWAFGNMKRPFGVSILMVARKRDQSG